MAAATGWSVRYTDQAMTVLWDREWHGKMPPFDARPLAIGKVDADVVVMQRVTRKHWCEIIPLLQEQGIKVVVDMDDNFEAVDKSHVSSHLFDPRLSPARNWKWAREACRRADLVTVTTPALLKVYGFGHGLVLPNMIPQSYLEVEPEVKMMVAGWSGWVGTHPKDLQVVGDGVARVLKESPGWGFHVIGSGRGVAEALQLTEEPTNTGEAWVPFAAYPSKVAELSIGVVPLAMSTFNNGKSALKLLEFSALGVATVASPTPDNIRLHRLGLGELARRPAAWYDKMRALVQSPLYCDELAGKSREAAATQTIEANVEQWVRAWDRR